MGTALAVQNGAPIAVIDEWTDARKEFIRKAFCGGADDITAATFLQLCERRRLSPEARHVYLVNRAKRGSPPNWVIQTGIDGYRLIADRTGSYVGSKDPVFVHDPEGRLAIATVTVCKLVTGVVGEFTASARWDEYAVQSQMWDKMPHTMLAKCAEALALRKAFPEELSGLYTDSEMDQSDMPAPSRGTARVDTATGEILDAPAIAATATIPDEERWEGGCTKKQLQRLNIIRQQKGISADGLKKLHGKTSGKLLTEAEADALIAQISDYPDIVLDDPETDTDQAPMFDANDPDRFTR